MMVLRFCAASGDGRPGGVVSALAVSLILFAVSASAQEAAEDQAEGADEGRALGPVASLIEERLAAPNLTVGGVALPVGILRSVYEENGFAPIWSTADGYEPSAAALAEAMRRVDREGLEPADYYPPLVEDLLDADDLPARVEGELFLSTVLIRYADHVRTGRVDPGALSAEFDYETEQLDYAPIVLGAEDAKDMDAYLASIAPQDRHYQGLRQALAEMREIATEGGWPEVEATETIHPGDRSDAIPALRERLAAMGFYEIPVQPEAGPPDRQVTDEVVVEDAADDSGAEEMLAEAPPNAAQDQEVRPTGTENVLPDERLYDDATVAAVEGFQEAYGLEVDGVIGQQTFGAIAGTVEDRIGQIIASMERWRWLPDEIAPDDRYIVVNIPSFELSLYEDDEFVRTMRIVVGQPRFQTPLFSSAVTWLEWNPTWTVPVSIAQNEYLPELIQDPYRLVSQNIRLYSDWGSNGYELNSTIIDWSRMGSGIRSMMLRQDPGPGNALGKVKFMLANNFSVYLHDTPSRQLFGRSTRAYSHGCVRVQDPLWLAEYLLDGNPHWTEGRRSQVMNSWATTRVNLTRHMPVHIVYLTAWWDEEAAHPVFRGDIYGIDEMVLSALDRFHADQMEVALID